MNETSQDIDQLVKRITVDPEIVSGKPNIKRITVAYVLYQFAHGLSIDDLITHHPELEAEDVLACLVYAARKLDE